MFGFVYRKMLKIIVLSFLLASVTWFANADVPYDSLLFRNAEDSLAQLANRIPEPRADEGRMQNHARFSDYLGEVLMYDHAFAYPFDSLHSVSMLYAPGKNFRIITWYVPLSGQRFHYSGFVQFPDEYSNTKKLLPLHDATADTDRFTAAELNPDSWYGAFYYDIIQEPGMEHYILLGWKGDNPQTRLRVIEPMIINDDRPVFGSQVFGEPFDDEWRIVFEYSARVSMSLLYETERINSRAGSHPMIVFDRLEPAHASLRGHYQFYKPEANIFDGLYFDGNKWRFQPDVDIRMRNAE